jgi:hypothetical protein
VAGDGDRFAIAAKRGPEAVCVGFGYMVILATGVHLDRDAMSKLVEVQHRIEWSRNHWP